MYKGGRTVSLPVTLDTVSVDPPSGHTRQKDILVNRRYRFPGSCVPARWLRGLQVDGTWLLYRWVPAASSLHYCGPQSSGENGKRHTPGSSVRLSKLNQVWFWLVHSRRNNNRSAVIFNFQTINKTKALSEFFFPLCRVQLMASCTLMTDTPSVTVIERPSACAGSGCGQAVSSAGESHVS